MSAALMLTDTDPRFDRRVTVSWEQWSRPTLCVLPRRPPPLARRIAQLVTVTVLPFAWLAYARGLRGVARKMHGHLDNRTAGLRGFANVLARSITHFWRDRRRLKAASTVYAHDQACGVVAVLNKWLHGVPYEYDAHEIVPFRARRTGVFRLILEFALERIIVRNSARCHVVNRPMKRIYARLYGPAPLVIRPNDFFDDRSVALDPRGPRLMLYIGATGPYRRMGDMMAVARINEARVVVFCEDPDQVRRDIGADEVLGLADYEPVLLDRLAGSAAYLWCFFDASVLSYRYSLPNKFFQALALGVPIVAAEGTYLGRLIARHGFGMVLRSVEDARTAGLWDVDAYRRAAAAMLSFRASYRQGRVSGL